jgi:hypothetical protein
MPVIDIDMWGTDPCAQAPSLAARTNPVQSPAAARLTPTKTSAAIVLENMTMPAALDPEVIRLDKWIPMLPDFHR